MNPNIFREYDIRGIVGEDLNEQTVSRIAEAIAIYFRKHNAKKIIVGCDARKSSPQFREILISKSAKAQIDVSDIGLVPTPVLYYTLFTENADGAVMITGSHNPSHHNGFKISLGRNSLCGEEIQKIKNIAFSNETVAAENFISPGKRKKKNFLPAYLDELQKRFSLGNRKLKVVIDAGNGTGGLTAVPLYKNAGAEIIELFCDPDSDFPNHEPDPSQKENLQDLIAEVIAAKADIGIAFDGDADRITIIDETGRIIWGDELMILLSREVLKEFPNSTIIAEVKCTQILFDEIRRLGGKAVMSKAGHSVIKAKMRETNAVLAGEMSGHIFFADRFYGFDDAAYAGARILEILSETEKTVSEIFAEFPQTVSTPEIRIACSEEKKNFVIEKIISEFSAEREIITVDGARIKFPNGWALVRPSNTQKLLILRFEADSQENLLQIKNAVESKVYDILSHSF